MPSPARAEPRVLDRILAVVGEHVVSLRDVRRRIEPNLVVVRRHHLPDWKLTEVTRGLVSEMLDKMIDEILYALAARAAGLSVVEDTELDTVMARVAKDANISLDVLKAHALEDGWPETELRAHFRRQIVRSRVLRLAYTRKRGPIPDIEVLEAFEAEWLSTQRKLIGVERRLAPLPPKGSSVSEEKGGTSGSKVEKP